eukprot:TRINITY_DN14434_c0_g1_i2.p1 TRINITY_DN14434_c0_g1~~TRINITY_DN14434_c0_g1_i2.p1  ORF type:complete len:221 (-),score=79.24 TRINITY_DN14434_c0_g1_i2:81-710(-)
MEEVYQNLKEALKVENTSPTPYELQKRFDSMDKKPERTPYHGFVVSDAANLIDLSNSTENKQPGPAENIPIVVHKQSDLVSQQGIPLTVMEGNQSTELHGRNLTNNIPNISNLIMPAGVNESQGFVTGSSVASSFVESSFIPSIISEAVSTTPTPSSSLLPVVLDDELSSCSTYRGSEQLDSEDEDQDKLDRIEQDIDQSADLLANLGF